MRPPRRLRRIGPLGRSATAGRLRARPQAAWAEHDLVAFADDAQHPVTVFVTEVGDIEAGGFEDA
jgi:hypothetical protein